MIFQFFGSWTFSGNLPWGHFSGQMYRQIMKISVANTIPVSFPSPTEEETLSTVKTGIHVDYCWLMLTWIKKMTTKKNTRDSTVCTENHPWWLPGHPHLAMRGTSGCESTSGLCQLPGRVATWAVDDFNWDVYWYYWYFIGILCFPIGYPAIWNTFFFFVFRHVKQIPECHPNLLG